jgi:hypothetical protein
LKKTNKISAIVILLLLPLISEAGYIKNIFLDQSTLTIDHHNCRLKSPFKEKRKLILPLDNCASRAGKINVTEFGPKHLTKIHWAQHDRKTVWIVATFLDDYQFDIQELPGQYLVCLPNCQLLAAVQNRSEQIRETKKMMFVLNGLLFQIPLQGMLIDEFIERSIGYVPKDFVRDGLPHFGSKRDDWKGKTRSHQGYDIYADKINVIAAAAGTVTAVRRNSRAGLYIKLHHGSGVYSLYVHLKKAVVKTGQSVKQGQLIGTIEGPTGNAVEAQLHFEIKPNDRSVDPLPLIEEFYQTDRALINKINFYKKALSETIQRRNDQVQEFLRNNSVGPINK